MGNMESIYTELALNGSKNECARTDTVLLPISEVCNGTVSLGILPNHVMLHCISLECQGQTKGDEEQENKTA